MARASARRANSSIRASERSADRCQGGSVRGLDRGQSFSVRLLFRARPVAVGAVCTVPRRPQPALALLVRGSDSARRVIPRGLDGLLEACLDVEQLSQPGVGWFLGRHSRHGHPSSSRKGGA